VFPDEIIKSNRIQIESKSLNPPLRSPTARANCPRGFGSLTCIRGWHCSLFPPSREYGTHKTVKARFRFWLSGQSPSEPCELFPLRFAGQRRGLDPLKAPPLSFSLKAPPLSFSSLFDNLTPQTLNPAPFTLNPEAYTLHPKLWTLNSKP
jgi:hypothetical protein